MKEQKSEIKNIKIATILNVVFTILEFTAGIWTNSVAIISKGIHDFGDSVALIISWYAEKRSQEEADQKRTFGYQRASTFSALFLGIILLVGTLFILTKAVPRLLNPQPIKSVGMIGVAVLGLFFNGLALMNIGQGKEVNEKAVSWHLLEDVLGWSSILVGAVVVYFFQYPIIDPIITIGYSLYIIKGVYQNMKEAVNILMEGVPEDISLKKVKKEVSKIDGVIDVHDVHIWTLEGEVDIFTAHIVVKEELLKDIDKTKRKIKSTLKDNDIEHSTIELESKNFCSGVECK